MMILVAIHTIFVAGHSRQGPRRSSMCQRITLHTSQSIHSEIRLPSELVSRRATEILVARHKSCPLSLCSVPQRTKLNEHHRMDALHLGTQQPTRDGSRQKKSHTRTQANQLVPTIFLFKSVTYTFRDHRCIMVGKQRNANREISKGHMQTPFLSTHSHKRLGFQLLQNKFSLQRK